MSSCHTFRPVPGQCGPRGRGPLPAPPFDPQDYWATRKLVSSLFGSLETTKLDKVDVVDPSTATEDGKAAEAKSTYKELTRISGMASDARVLAESKADKLSSQQLAAVNSGIDADKVAKIAQNESAISAEVSRATTEEARLQALINAIKTFEAVVADSLPIPSEQYSKKLYLIPSTNPETRNVKDEFICVKVDNVWGWEQVGSTAITIEFDYEPTEGSQKAARSGGIWSWVKSLLPHWLTSDYVEPATVESVATKADKTALDDKRDKDDRAVYKLVKSAFVLHKDGLTDVTLPFIGKDQSKPYPYNEYDWVYPVGETAAFHAIVFSDGKWKLNVDDGMEYGYSSASEDALRIEFDNGYVATRSSIVSTVPVDDRQLASVATDDTLKPSDGNLVKYDAANDRLVAAIAGEDYRDSQDNTCHKTEFTEWTFNPSIPSGYSLRYEQSPLGYWGWFLYDANGKKDGGANHGGEYPDATNIIVPGYEWSGGYSFTATRSAVCSDGKRFVTEDVAAKQSDIKTKANSSALAPVYDATSAYSVGAIVYHDGNIYQCKTAIAEGGEAWNAEHWELRKLDGFFTESNSLLTGTIDAEVISKGTAPDAHLEAPTDERLKLVLADNSVAYDSAKALPYKLTSAIGDRVIATMTLTAASTDITLPAIAANDTTVKDFILDVTNAYAVEGVATDAGINIPRTDFKLVTRDGESLTDVTTVKAGKSAFICFTQKSPVVVDGTTYPCWCVIQLPFGDPS